VKQFAEDLHAAGQHYVVIVDPGIHNRTGYQPYEDLLEQQAFIRQGDGVTPFIGKVWPGYTVRHGQFVLARATCGISLTPLIFFPAGLPGLPGLEYESVLVGSGRELPIRRTV
jgi:hypothetical protein